MLNAILFSLLGAVFWGVGPIFGKLGLQKVPVVDGFSIRILITLVMLTVWILSTGGLTRIWSISGLYWFYFGIEAFLVSFAGDLAYYAVLKWGQPGLASVAFSAYPVVTIVLSHLVFGESFSIKQTIGTIMVILGIYLVLSGNKML